MAHLGNRRTPLPGEHDETEINKGDDAIPYEHFDTSSISNDDDEDVIEESKESGPPDYNLEGSDNDQAGDLEGK